jgi:subtilisin family serine protease
LVNYIRYWHNNIKTVNPATGRKNPTVVNMSFGQFGNAFPKNNTILMINQLYYRGTTTNHPTTPPAGQSALQATYNYNWVPQQFYDAGIQVYDGYINAYGVILAFYTGQDAAAQQAIIDGANEGIIWVAAAGNQYNEAGYFSTHPNYVNYFNLAYATFGALVLYQQRFHNRLPTPGAAEANIGTSNFRTCIVVGNISSLADQSLSYTSSAGNKVTVWAPGENIMSAYNAAGIPDPRNNAFYLAKLTGTSMASPQVAGVIACNAELYPDKQQMQHIEWLNAYANYNNIPDLGIPLPPGPVSNFGLREAPNVFMEYYNDRPINGNTWPQKRWWIRPTNGLAYPRQTIRRRNIW